MKFKKKIRKMEKKFTYKVISHSKSTIFQYKHSNICKTERKHIRVLHNKHNIDYAIRQWHITCTHPSSREKTEYIVTCVPCSDTDDNPQVPQHTLSYSSHYT